MMSKIEFKQIQRGEDAFGLAPTLPKTYEMYVKEMRA